jgi:ethanolamine ammonia-lyase large subunit
MDAHELRRTLSLANAFKEGDAALGGTSDDRVRHDARQALLATTIGAIQATPLIDDGVTVALQRSRNRRLDGDIISLTVAQARAALLGPNGAAWANQYGAALGSEAIAAVTKVMTDDELSSVASGLCHALPGGDAAIGSPQHFGSRIQPNSAGDDEQEILFSILEGLSYGCGDVIIGLNPAADDLDTIIRLEQLLEQVVRRLDLPTRYCVLSDIVKQHQAQRRTHVDVGFQSLAGTSRSLMGMVGLDVDGLLDLSRSFGGLYFETGQGAEVTNGTAEGVDMVTLESRTYGVARHLRQQSSVGWTIVNDVAGFIGPEVFTTAEQLERACLEDTVMARLHGLTMGLDVCATFHMGISPHALRRLTARISERARPAYLMAVAGNADPMLGYLTTSFREHPTLRRQVGRDMTSAMRHQLETLGVRDGADDASGGSRTVARLYATYVRAGGDRRPTSALEEEAEQCVHDLQARGLDLGCDAATADARLERIYANARAALYATVEDHVIRDVTAQPARVRTIASSRDDYLSHPAAGERLRDDDARAVALLGRDRQPQVQIVVSDGLNANAVNEQLPALLPKLRRTLSEHGLHVGPKDVVVQNGRVRAGYEIGGLVGADVVINIIGERPGTGINTLSAYITYGRDAAGQSRWSRSLDHSATTAVCGIHARAKAPEAAASEIARAVARIVQLRKSGVAAFSSG